MTLSERYQRLLNSFSQAGQSQVFQFWDELNENEREQLLNQLETLPVKSLSHLNDIFKQSMSVKQNSNDIKPFPIENIANLQTADPNKVQEWHKLGLKSISEGKVAVLLLAGGQGTRLKSTLPKGMFDMELLSGKTLYQLQGERINKLMQLAKAEYPNSNPIIYWYIMTSEATNVVSEEYFQKHNYFGLDPKTVIFFNQESLPCMSDPEGKILLETKSSVALAPNGNGGLYTSLKREGVLQHMRDHNVTYVHSYCVDNILVKVADPIFIGYCAEQNVDVGAKVVAKRDAREAVGVFAIKDGKNNVVEYSEIPEELSLAIDPNTNRLAFNAGNIANFFYTVDFLAQCAEDMANHDEYHIAKKKIRAATEQGTIDFRDAIKLELFNFDVVPFAKHVALLEVPRDLEFAPLKNDNSAKNDNAITCRESLSQAHKKFFEQAGGTFTGEGLFEISPELTYAGEGLENVKPKNVKLPCYLKE